MPTLEEVPPKLIFSKAISILRNARHEIFATMDLAEELSSPLPQEYFFLLKRKAGQKVKIHRLAFGTQKDWRAFLASHKGDFTSPNYQSRQAPLRGYQRMLLVDDTRLLFAHETEQGRRYFYTTNREWIGYFSDYFTVAWKKARKSGSR